MTDGEPLAQLRSSAALVYVEDLTGDDIEVVDAHHLLDVLRLRDGEIVITSDGRGAYRSCRAVLSTGRRAGRGGQMTLEPIAPVVWTEPPSRALTVAFALQKGDRPDWAVQKLTEIGIDRIVPLLTERTVVRLNPSERERRGDRFRRIAREAAAQSRRLRLPEISDPQEFSVFTATLDRTAMLAEPNVPGSLAGCSTLLVGPEGGWSESELDCGLDSVGLGPTVLRAETAALVGGALLSALRTGVIAAIH